MNSSFGSVKRTITVTLADLTENDLSNMVATLQSGLHGTTPATNREGWALKSVLEDARKELSHAHSEIRPVRRESVADRGVEMPPDAR